MKRREFITLVGGAAAWPVAARAQQAMPVIGFFRSTTLADSAYLVTAFRQGLKEAGFVEGQNVTVEYRFADNQKERVTGMAVDLAANITGVCPEIAATSTRFSPRSKAGIKFSRATRRDVSSCTAEPSVD
jgi:putative ABC transport system substrate-binding protein